MSPERIQRASRIRSRIVASATALFVALFGVIGVRLASGHDPALSKSTSTSTSAGTNWTSPSSSSSTTGDDDQLTTSDQPSQDVSPVTTSQS